MLFNINKTFDRELKNWKEGKNMSKHTNGPWNKVLAPTQIVAGDKIIANINHELLGTHEGYANAALIAAAPCLLEALNMVSKYIDQFGDAKLTYSQIKTIVDAIAKAEGR